MSDTEIEKEEEAPQRVNDESTTSTSIKIDVNKTDSTDDDDESEKEKESESEKSTDKVKEEKQKNEKEDKAEEFAAYEEHMSYDADGSAIYTDPSTKQKYKWCHTKHQWQPITTDGEVVVNTDSTSYENEHYKWCAETKQWVRKDNNVTETEHYKWDAEQHKWVLKNQPTDKDNSQEANKNIVIDENGERTYTDKDGVVFFWDTAKSAWFPKIDDDFMARYQMNYGFIDNTTAGEEERAAREAAEVQRKADELKRMTEEARAAMNKTATSDSSEQSSGNVVVGKRKAQEPPKWFDLDPAQNTKVYVSNLPLDITMDEFTDLMGKCGMIMRDPQTQKYKLKLYTEPSGQIKGDGLCDYIKVESVNLALEILDEYNVRGHKIKVQRAKFQMRGDYNPALKPKRKKKDKEKLQKMKEKLFDWRPEKMRGERSKNEKSVIIKNLFTPEIFETEVELILEYQNNLRDECTKCGTVRKVVIYDRHADGVAQINMSSPEEADVVIQMMHGRFFGQRKLTAEHWDGKTKYKIDETAAEANERLSKWDEYLAEEEQDDDDDDDHDDKADATVVTPPSETSASVVTDTTPN